MATLYHLFLYLTAFSTSLHPPHQGDKVPWDLGQADGGFGRFLVQGLLDGGPGRLLNNWEVGE